MSVFLESWRDEGACQALIVEDERLFEAFYGTTTKDRKPAKSVCGTCPVRLQCLKDALERKEIWGVWGGCDEVELRRALSVDTNGTERQRQRFPRCPNCQASTEYLETSRDNEVGCQACRFTWTAASSTAAINIFHELEGFKAPAKVVPITRRSKARVPRGRIPSGRPVKKNQPVQPGRTTSGPEANLEVRTALVASAKAKRSS